MRDWWRNEPSTLVGEDHAVWRRRVSCYDFSPRRSRAAVGLQSSPVQISLTTRRKDISMKLVASFALVAIILTISPFVTSSDVHANAGSYCDGHRDGHRAGSETFGMGYPGYPGCPGDPGSPGGSASVYQRGFAAGMRDITRELCRGNSTHPNCR